MRICLARPMVAMLIVSIAGACTSALSAAVVVPNASAATDGDTSFAGPLSRFARTYQLLIDDTQLSGIVGQQITGVTWRLPGGTATSWPASDVNYTAFNIFLSGSVEPSARSATMANNIVGPQTQVRSGALTIPASAFPGTGASPNAFGFVINFNSPYTYSGGNLLLELRQSAHDGTDQSVDAVGTSTPGYGTAFSAQWDSGIDGTVGIAANAIVTQFITVVPEPTSIAMIGSALGALLKRKPRE